MPEIEGLLLLNKPVARTSFNLVAVLRRLLGVKKIGHAGTLDPFATGVMVMLIGRQFTRISDQFLGAEKEYLARIRFGMETDTFDCDGQIIAQSDKIPSNKELEEAISHFQGEIEQVPPMFSAKKINGKKLYELARAGKEVVRPAIKVKVVTQLISYEYPYADIRVTCSKGTYIRTIAHDLGRLLGCGGHLSQLKRTRSGHFLLAECFDGSLLYSPNINVRDLCAHIRQS